MSYKKLSWFFSLFIVFSFQANADGNDLLQKCNKAVQFMDSPPENPDFGSIGFCLGMMQGITNLNSVYEIRLEDEALFCGPEDGINNGQATRIVVKYLKDNPQDLHQHEGVLAIAAFMDAYPCE
ncbi:Rap1a/Tai family immunity protein [Marinobacter metalliresistant]|uniref:Rap1a immunity protein domain-containing protein n=1 Tax=Marinobacter metalliresistant TaxID=2961995 RepID=A0ABZ2VX65_9GAMM